jgi:Outer membrane protein LpxR
VSLLVACGRIGSAEDDPPYQEPRYTGTTIYFDEDTFMFPSTDQDYTTGLQFTVGGRFARRAYPLSAPLAALDWFTIMKTAHGSLCPDDGAGICQIVDGQPRGYQAHTLLVGLTYFTPRKGNADDPECVGVIREHGCVLALTKPLHDDRPYASILFATVSHETARGRTALLSDFTVGALGLDVAKKVQTWWHTGLGNDVTPGGWGNQISNGGELTLKYRATWRRLLATVFTTRPTGQVDFSTPGGDETRLPLRKLDLTADVEANAGFYTNVMAGARLRWSPFGRIDSPFWSAQRHPVNPVKKLKTAVAPAAKKRAISEAYFWVSGGTTLWAYNALLQGQFKHSEVTLPFDGGDDPGKVTNLRRAIWDYELGATVRFGEGACFLKHFGLSYQYNRHAPLFTGPHTRQHAWGGFYLGIY